LRTECGRNLPAKIDYAASSYFDQHHSFEKTIASNITAPYQHVELDDLEPNTSYTYQVRPSGDESAFSDRTFQTMPVSGPFTFIVISDSQEGHNYTEMKRFRYVAEAIANETDVLFILHGGDYAGHKLKPQSAPSANPSLLLPPCPSPFLPTPAAWEADLV